MKLSEFGEKFTGKSGITSLMDDLGNALASREELIMMGGGNPAHIPQIETVLKKRMEKILSDKDAFRRLIGIYDPPLGNSEFIKHLASLFKKEFGLTPHAYIINQKLNRSKKLLSSHEFQNISQVSQECGFYDQSHLHRNFLNFFNAFIYFFM